MRSQILKKALFKTLPVMAGYIVLGIGFGILLGNAGYGLPWSFAMGVFIYAGSMQYVYGLCSLYNRYTRCFLLNSEAILQITLSAPPPPRDDIKNKILFSLFFIFL